MCAILYVRTHVLKPTHKQTDACAYARMCEARPAFRVSKMSVIGLTQASGSVYNPGGRGPKGRRMRGEREGG